MDALHLSKFAKEAFTDVQLLWQDLLGGITQIKIHLASMPKLNVSVCEKCPADVKEQMMELLKKESEMLKCDDSD